MRDCDGRNTRRCAGPCWSAMARRSIWRKSANLVAWLAANRYKAMSGHDPAEGHNRGELVEEYRASSFRQLLYLAGSLAFIAGGVTLLWIAISFGDGAALLLGVFSLLMLVSGAFLCWQACSIARLRVLLFEQGFVYRK